MKRKKIISGLLAGVMVLSLEVPASAAPQSGDTKITLSITDAATDYILTVPTSVPVEKSGWTAWEDGLNVKSVKGGFPTEKKVVVTASSQNGWKLDYEGESKDAAPIGYILRTEEGGSAVGIYEFTGQEVNTATEGQIVGKTQPLGVDVADFTSAKEGTYRDVITFNSVVHTIDGTYVTIAAGNRATAVQLAYTEGETWDTLATRESSILESDTLIYSFNPSGTLMACNGSSCRFVDSGESIDGQTSYMWDTSVTVEYNDGFVPEAEIIFFYPGSTWGDLFSSLNTILSDGGTILRGTTRLLCCENYDHSNSNALPLVHSGDTVYPGCTYYWAEASDIPD